MAPFPEAVRRAVEDVRPVVQLEGGDIRLVDADEASGTVTIALLGSCADCDGPHAEILPGVSRAIRRAVPAVREVKNLSPDDLRMIDAHRALEAARGCAPGGA